MPVAISYPILKEIRISSILQHVFIIICFQESRMALTEIFDHPLAGCSYICKNTDINSIRSKDKTMWICGIMVFWESGYSNGPDLYWFKSFKFKQQFWGNLYTSHP